MSLCVQLTNTWEWTQILIVLAVKGCCHLNQLSFNSGCARLPWIRFAVVEDSTYVQR